MEFFESLIFVLNGFFDLFFHQGTRGRRELFLVIPIVILVVSVIMSVKSPTSDFTLFGEGVGRLEVFFCIREEKGFQLAFLIYQRCDIKWEIDGYFNRYVVATIVCVW